MTDLELHIPKDIVPQDLIPKDNDLRNIAGEGNFIPNLTLVHPNSDDAQNIKPGHYAYKGVDQGPDVKIYVIAKRWHAILFEGNAKKMESFNIASDISNKIRQLGKDRSRPADLRPRAGTSFLVWLPQATAFAVFHTASWSAKSVETTILNHIQPVEERPNEALKQLPHTKCFILSAFRNEKGKQAYWQPKCTPSESDYMDACSEEQMKEAMEIFYAPLRAEASSNDASNSGVER